MKNWQNYALCSKKRPDMHEISLVRTIFRTLEEQFQPDELERVETIELKIGPLANVESILLQNAFDAVVAEDETGASEFIDQLAQKYLGTNYPWRNPKETRVTYKILPEKIG